MSLASFAREAASEWKAAEPTILKILAAIKAAQENPTVVEIENNFPAAARLAGKISGMLPIAGEAINTIDLIANYGPLLIEFANVAGIQPMEWGKPNDPKAEALLRERDRLTGG